MSSVPILKAAGLYTDASEIDGVPEGALNKAEDVVIRAKNVIEPRRGQEERLLSPSLASDVREVFFYEGQTLAHTEGNTLISIQEDGTNTDLGTVTPVDPGLCRVRGFEIQDNFYVNSANGILRLDSPFAAPTITGGPRANGIAAFAQTDAAGFLPPDSVVAYRVVFSRLDANDNEIVGPPSGRFVVNSNGAVTNSQVVIGVLPPFHVDTSTVVQIYRSEVTTSPAQPSDQMGLVFRRQFTLPAELTNGIEFVDRVPEAFVDDPLYTNLDSSDEAVPNYPPPVSLDTALWAERAWYANTHQKEQVDLRILGVGAGTGLRSGDILVIEALTGTGAIQKYVAWDSTGVVPGDLGTFGSIYTTCSSFDAYRNIETTGLSFVDRFNRVNRAVSDSIDNRFIAEYTSTSDSVPGELSIEALDFDASEFKVYTETYPFTITNLSRTGSTVTVTTAFAHGFTIGDTVTLTATTPNADFPVGDKVVVTGTYLSTTFTYTEAGTATATSAGGYRAARLTSMSAEAWSPTLTPGLVASDNDRAPHRLYYSKVNQPEAVPLLNYLDIGVKGKAIQRIIPLRDRLYVFKEEGLYVVGGSDTFRADLLDDTVKIVAPDTAITVSNQVFAFTNQGVVSVNEQGASIVSRAIESDIIKLFTEEDQALLKGKAFAVAHETDRLYSLWLHKRGEAEVSYAFVYNTLLGVWTRWNLARTCGRVNPVTDKLIQGGQDQNLFQERRTYTYADYCESTVTRTALAYNFTTGVVTLSSSVSGLAEGCVLRLGLEGSGGTCFRISAVDGTLVTLDPGSDGLPFVTTPSTVSLHFPIPSEVRWTNQDAGSPNDLKQFPEAHALFKVADFMNGNMTFSTDLTPTRSSVPFKGKVTNVDPTRPWGEFDQIGQGRVTVDQEHQYAAFMRPGLLMNETFGFWQCIGMTLVFVPSGPAVTM